MGNSAGEQLPLSDSSDASIAVSKRSQYLLLFGSRFQPEVCFERSHTDYALDGVILSRQGKCNPFAVG